MFYTYKLGRQHEAGRIYLQSGRAACSTKEKGGGHSLQEKPGLSLLIFPVISGWAWSSPFSLGKTQYSNSTVHLSAVKWSGISERARGALDY